MRMGASIPWLAAREADDSGTRPDAPAAAPAPTMGAGAATESANEVNLARPPSRQDAVVAADQQSPVVVDPRSDALFARVAADPMAAQGVVLLEPAA